MSYLKPMTDDLESVAAYLQGNLTGSPHDFVRSIDVVQDRNLHIKNLARHLDADTDLRFIYQDKLALFAEKLMWDTDFFGYPVARLSAVYPLEDANFDDYVAAIRLFCQHAIKRGIRYVFAPVDPTHLELVQALCNSKFSLIETRCYYHLSLKDYHHERYDCRLATPEDIPTLGQAAQMMVNHYDRFHADPFINPEDASRLMYKWVEASLLHNFADATVVPNAPQPSAFCTVKFHQDKWDAWGVKLSQPVFSAVSPEFKGWYLKIISEINYHLRDVIGAEHAYLITQITNKAVIYVWEKLGYRFGKGEHIFRVVLA